jgi:hypothetical protein
MKKLIFLLSVAFLMLQSCSSEDTNNNVTPTPQSNLVYKWNLNKSQYKNVNQTLSTCRKQTYIQFNINGTFERKDYFLIDSSCLLVGFDSGTYNYSVVTSKITLNFSDPSDGAQVEKLNNVSITSTTLKYSWDEDGDGIDEINLEFTK